ncbi:hypothetical protein CFIICLFH_3789 [Methylobacterium goesingense]|nr:hypothetical protein CFIICLFH_3789 [Methylobacterium goesingense]
MGLGRRDGGLDHPEFQALGDAFAHHAGEYRHRRISAVVGEHDDPQAGAVAVPDLRGEGADQMRQRLGLVADGHADDGPAEGQVRLTHC